MASEEPLPGQSMPTTQALASFRASMRPALGKRYACQLLPYRGIGKKPVTPDQQLLNQEIDFFECSGAEDQLCASAAAPDRHAPLDAAVQGARIVGRIVQSVLRKWRKPRGKGSAPDASSTPVMLWVSVLRPPGQLSQDTPPAMGLGRSRDMSAPAAAACAHGVELRRRRLLSGRQPPEPSTPPAKNPAYRQIPSG